MQLFNRDKKLISIVIPCYNEEKNISLLHDELTHALKNVPFDYELIFVEDGSKDDTWGELKKLAHKDKRVKLLQHGRNMGLSQAYQNGFDHAKGEYVLIFASDLETEAKEIVRVVKKLDEGYDIVNTHRIGRWKSNKSVSFLRTLPSEIANRLIIRITGVELKDNGSGLKGFKRFVLENLKMYGEMHRYFAAFCGVYTDKIIEIKVGYRERVYGKSAYGSITRTFKVLFDLFSLKFFVDITKKPYRLMPGRLFGSVGLGFAGIGSLISFYLFIEKVVFGESIGGRPLLTFGVLFLILGVQLVMTGFLGELLMRIYFDTGDRKVYTVREKVNFED